MYRIHFNDKGKSYIGITVNFPSRKYQHLKNAKTGNDHHLYRAIRKYGMPIFEILEEAPDYTTLLKLEQKYIHEFDTYNNGYNMTLGGEGTLGLPRPKSEFWRKTQSNRMSGSNNSMYGKKYSEEARKNHSLLMKEFYDKNPNKKSWGNKSSTGKIWINDGSSEAKISKDMPIPDGFTRGRCFKKMKTGV